MDEKSLRKLIGKEVDDVLDEQIRMDAHPKFRRLVSQKLGRILNEGECFDETWSAWNDMLVEAAGEEPEDELVDHYVTEAATSIKLLTD
jgi:hypothetical protein